MKLSKKRKDALASAVTSCTAIYLMDIFWKSMSDVSKIIVTDAAKNWGYKKFLSEIDPRTRKDVDSLIASMTEIMQLTDSSALNEIMEKFMKAVYKFLYFRARESKQRAMSMAIVHFKGSSHEKVITDTVGSLKNYSGETKARLLSMSRPKITEEMYAAAKENEAYRLGVELGLYTFEELVEYLIQSMEEAIATI